MSDALTFRLSAIQAALQARLQSHPWFADLPVLTEAKGDIENEIARALGALSGVDGKIGACVVILTPTAKCQNPNAPGPILDPLTVVVAAIESVTVNQGDQGTKKHAAEIAEMILRRLHHFVSSECNAAFTAAPDAFRISTADPLTYEVMFHSKLALQPEQN